MMMANPNEDLMSLLKKLLEELCTAGKSSLDEQKIQKVKKICKQSDYYVVSLYKILMKYLQKKHAEIRLSAFQICNVIFFKSHCFRELLLRDFNMIIDYALGLNPKKPLPKPLTVSDSLVKAAIAAIQSWNDAFRDKYLLLNLSYKYLRDCKKVDFVGMEIVTEVQRQQRQELRRKEEEIRNNRIRKIKDEMEEKLQDISNTIKEFNSGFKLLIPDLQDFFISHDGDLISDQRESPPYSDDSDCGLHWMREHGLNKDTVIQVDLSDIHTIHKNSDNEIIILTLQELVNNIRKTFLPMAKRWEQTVIKYSDLQAELLKSIIDIKGSLEKVVKLFSSLKILPSSQVDACHKFYHDSDSDNDLIDIPFYDEIQTEETLILGKDLCKSQINEKDLVEAGPSGVRKLTLTDVSSEAQNRSKSREISKESQDIDSLAMNNCEKPYFFKRTISDVSSVWAANEALHDHEPEHLKDSGLLGIATKAVNYEVEWKPVTWKCGHLFPSGRLCPRQDRERCPLHGPIVPRDENGIPLKLEDAEKEKLEREEYERKNPPWQESSLLADIKSNTGVDLAVNMKGRKRKYSNLTDLRKLENTPHSRLAKKVLGSQRRKCIQK